MENIKATRMELLTLKRRLKTAQRGYKLLKEKRDGLMKKFMEIVRQVRFQRKELENALGVVFQKFVFATSNVPETALWEMFLVPTVQLQINVATENIMSVWIPKFQYSLQGEVQCYSAFSAPLGLGEALLVLQKNLPLLIELAEKEHSGRLLSFEIEKTRRRVNALEYVIIPQLEKKIKFITAKLDEQERSEKIIRLRLKAQFA